MVSARTRSPQSTLDGNRLWLGAAALAGALLSPATAAGAADIPQSSSFSAASRWTLPPPNLRKRAVLLGGPSRMEQVLLEQGSVESTGPEPAVTDSFTAPPPAAESYVAGQPNLFGTVGIPISATPLDAQWRRASSSRPTRALGRWAGATGAEYRDSGEEQIHLVNRWVNRAIQFADDSVSHGRGDRWSSATESIKRGSGDCEDFALAKMQLLSALGFSGEKMYLVVVRDLVRQADHAVLAVELDGRFLILDNVTDEVLDSSSVSDYRPIFSYSSAGRWVHGYAYAADNRPIRTASGIAASR